MKNPWLTEDGETIYVDVDSRLAVVKRAGIEQLKAMIAWPSTQKTVITSAERRLRKLTRQNMG